MFSSITFLCLYFWPLTRPQQVILNCSKEALKVMLHINFHRNSNRYREYNNIIEKSKFSATKLYTNIFKKLINECLLQKRKKKQHLSNAGNLHICICLYYCSLLTYLFSSITFLCLYFWPLTRPQQVILNCSKEALKVMLHINFHRNSNRYREYNNIIEKSKFSATKLYTNIFKKLINECLLQKRKKKQHLSNVYIFKFTLVIFWIFLWIEWE